MPASTPEGGVADHLDEPHQRCALLGLADEPLAGTSPHAPRWLLVEDPGPWGRDGLADGTLPAAVRAHIGTQVAAHDVRHQALRRVDRSRVATRRVMLVNVAAGWMAATSLSVAGLADLDVGLVAATSPPDGWDRITTPLVAVCTHAKRDACCALWGRPLALSLAARLPGVVWETSHTGGHRFAPSVLTFPDGGVHGRVADAAGFATSVVTGRIPLATYRGNSALIHPAQAAEVAVRHDQDLDGHGDVTVEEVTVSGTTALVTVTTASGSHRVQVQQQSLPARATSCGGDPKVPESWLVTALDGRPVNDVSVGGQPMGTA
ncbi:MAG TPA: sucrase ferredoxin [Nitriliruptoraceae bacterium]|nr:sucrase ferredoxin [Nitriliruptoraceae bacterium]